MNYQYPDEFKDAEDAANYVRANIQPVLDTLENFYEIAQLHGFANNTYFKSYLTEAMNSLDGARRSI